MAARRRVLTLVFVREGGKVLLGMKKTGIGEGRWNGFGGSVERGESIEQGAKRELVEECGVFAQSLRKVGCIDFEFEGDPIILEVHVFTSYKFTGLPFESEEMRPKWFPVDAIPYNDMWPDDKFWFPYVLAEKKFKAYFLFEGLNTILTHEIEEVQSFDN